MDDQEFSAARNRVVERYLLRLTFVFNLLFFMVILMVILSRADEARIGKAAAFGTFWGAILLVHLSIAFNPFRRLIDRAARRELERGQMEEKPKRSRLELGADGELLEIVDEWPLDEDEKEKMGDHS